MEKLALGLSLVCGVYAVLFFIVSYWLHIRTEQDEGRPDFDFIKVFQGKRRFHKGGQGHRDERPA